MSVSIYLRDTFTGSCGIYHMDDWNWRENPNHDQPDPHWNDEQVLSLIDSMFSDGGNYGCDCNRRLFLARALGDDPAWDGYPCGEGGIAIDCVLDENGKILYRDGQKVLPLEPDDTG